MKTNQAGIDLIKKSEGLALKAYFDLGGTLTVGYGHTGFSVTPLTVVTPEQAEALLRQDVEQIETVIGRMVRKPLTENQFSALVCFCYNVGVGNFRNSTMLRKINAGIDASNEFLKWIKVKGIDFPGLLTRRKAERELYLS